MSKKNLIFNNPSEMKKEEVLKVMSFGDYSAMSNALLATVFHEKDINFCIKIIQLCFLSEDDGVRGIAVLCIGHLARRHEVISEKVAIDILKPAFCDSSKFVRGQAENTLDDLEVFSPLIAENIKLKLGLFNRGDL